VISFRAEVQIHEEKVFTHLDEDKVFAHLDEEKECDVGTWVLDTRATNHMFGCRVAFTKIDTAVLGSVCFLCKNSES
jgi:hypothetical protein